MIAQVLQSAPFLLLAGAAMALLVLSLVTRVRTAPGVSDGGPVAAYLFHGESLVDCSPGAEGLLPGVRDGAGGGELARLVALLAPRFEGLAAMLDGLSPGGRARLHDDAGAMLTLERWGERLRVTVGGDIGAGGAALSLTVAGAELGVLRAIGESAPLPIWRETPDGHLTWANRAYLDLAALAAPDTESGWPPPRLFEAPPAPPGADLPSFAQRQIRLPEAAGPQWFEITSVPRDGDRMCFAVETTRMVIAEEARRSFMQVLTKTFAQLSTGLAVFDRRRQLVVFNPAFLDLTGLPTTFVAAQPTLGAVLDRLRDLKILPEPKNYRSWREQVMAVEAEAQGGSYRETWALPGGQTWRVVGRPHPDGAIAFFFEDITGEVALTRHFREELGLAQAVLDEVDEAIAVFSPGGRLAMSNESYERQWGNSEERLQEIVLTGEIETWRRRAAPTPVWERLRETADQGDGEAAWVGLVKKLDGKAVHVRVTSLAGGALMVAFRAAPLAQDGEIVVERVASARGLRRAGL